MIGGLLFRVHFRKLESKHKQIKRLRARFSGNIRKCLRAGLRIDRARPMDRQCEVCGQPMLAHRGRGRPPKVHPECARSDTARERLTGYRDDEDTATIRAGNAAQAARARARAEAAEVARPIVDARRLAVALRVYPDSPEDAAKLAGLAATGPELEELLERARRADHRGLVAGEHAATAATVGVSLALAAERLLGSMAEIPPKDIPFALKTLMDVAEEIGGLDPVPTRVTVVYRGERESTK